MRIAITGHRPNKLGSDYSLTGQLVTKIRNALQNFVLEPIMDAGVKPTLITGMALGIDTLWVELAIINKLPFIAAIPMKGQENMWPTASKNKYYNILAASQWIHVVDVNKTVAFNEYIGLEKTGYTLDKMQKRNIWMVDNSDFLVGVWDGTKGGTANCLEYADRIQKHTVIVRIPTMKYEIRHTPPELRDTLESIKSPNLS